MRNISICDISVRRSELFAGTSLPFRIKIEVAKMLSKVGVPVVEAAPVKNDKTDYFLVKTLASILPDTVIAVPVEVMDPESVSRTWAALGEASKPRLQVPVPVSTVQMEYIYHKKPDGILDLIKRNVSACAAVCSDVEFIALDFGRCERDFLNAAVNAAVESGATVVTVADIAGNMLPDEFYSSIKKIREILPENIRLGVYCANNLFLAEANAISAVRAGADEVKTIVYGSDTASLEKFARILNERSVLCDANCDIMQNVLQHTVLQINKLCESCVCKAPTAVSVPDKDAVMISSSDTIETVTDILRSLGYDLDGDDMYKVYSALMKLAAGNSRIAAKEVDAVVASVAFQVPVTYHIDSFVINTGNTVRPTCSIRLKKDNLILEDVCFGDGPVDAAFTAIDRAIGKHYELDDFQVRAVTEGREAMGETVVRLRNEGRLYSGRGVSKDIVESSLIAYLNAINKIAYEEAQKQ